MIRLASGSEPKPVPVQAFVSEPADEALHERVLDRLAGLDEAQPHAGPRRLGVHSSEVIHPGWEA
jgi:hypothetical protein